MRDYQQIVETTVEVVKTKQAMLDGGAVVTGFTVFGLSGAQWMAFAAGVLMVMRLVLTGIEIAQKLRAKRKG